MLNIHFSPWPSFSPEEADAVHRVVMSNKVNYWTGTETREFEKEYAAWCGTAHAVALACEAVTASDGPFEQPVMLVGGGTVDPRFRQLIADATGLTLAPVAAPDAAVLGAGLLAQGITHNPIAPELGDAIVPRESMTALLAERREHHIAHVRRGQEQ